VTSDSDALIHKRIDELRDDLRRVSGKLDSAIGDINANNRSFETFQTKYGFDTQNLDGRLRSIEASLQAAAQEARDASAWARAREDERKRAWAGAKVLAGVGSFALGVWASRHQIAYYFNLLWHSKP